jgi:glycerophosphoryl diester phosphodiesterase
LVLAALGSKELTDSRLDQIQRTGARIVGWDHQEIGAGEIEAIHARGLRAWVYTVNDPERAQALIKAGIDGIISDCPATMLPLVARSIPRP